MGQLGEIEAGRLRWHDGIMRDSGTVYNCLLPLSLRLNSYPAALALRITAALNVTGFMTIEQRGNTLPIGEPKRRKYDGTANY
jgi:hypothetical protein